MPHVLRLRRAAVRLRDTGRRMLPFSHARKLAWEFGTSAEVMVAFVNRFAPARVRPNRFFERADTMLFVHIPKTAGISVGKAFQQSFDRFYGVEWNNIPKSFRDASARAAYAQARGAGRQVIMGHFGWPELTAWRSHDMPLKCGTILRDPVERMVSNFNYNSSEAHPAHEQFSARFPTIQSWVEHCPLDAQLTQAIGLTTSFEAVLVKFVKHYTFIGLTERLPQSLAHLSRSHGLAEFAQHKENVGTKSADGLHEQVADLVRQRNQHDMKFHALMTRLYDLGGEI